MDSGKSVPSLHLPEAAMETRPGMASHVTLLISSAGIKAALGTRANLRYHWTSFHQRAPLKPSWHTLCVAFLHHREVGRKNFRL